MPGHSDRPSCRRNQAPSAIDNTVTEKMTKASAEAPMRGLRARDAELLCHAAELRCFLIRAGKSIPAPGLHAQPGGPDYHQLSIPIGRWADTGTPRVGFGGRPVPPPAAGLGNGRQDPWRCRSRMSAMSASVEISGGATISVSRATRT